MCELTRRDLKILPKLVTPRIRNHNLQTRVTHPRPQGNAGALRNYTLALQALVYPL